MRSRRIKIVSVDRLQNVEVARSQHMIRDIRVDHPRLLPCHVRRYQPTSSRLDRFDRAVAMRTVHRGRVIVCQKIVTHLFRDGPFVSVRQRADMLQSNLLTLALVAALDRYQPVERLDLGVDVGSSESGFVRIARLQRNLDGKPAVQPEALGASRTINLTDDQRSQIGAQPTQVA